MSTRVLLVLPRDATCYDVWTLTRTAEGDETPEGPDACISRAEDSTTTPRKGATREAEPTILIMGAGQM
jgi:hypothetical protein